MVCKSSTMVCYNPLKKIVLMAGRSGSKLHMNHSSCFDYAYQCSLSFST